MEIINANTGRSLQATGSFIAAVITCVTELHTLSFLCKVAMALTRKDGYVPSYNRSPNHAPSMFTQSASEFQLQA